MAGFRIALSQAERLNLGRKAAVTGSSAPYPHPQRRDRLAGDHLGADPACYSGVAA